MSKHTHDKLIALQHDVQRATPSVESLLPNLAGDRERKVARTLTGISQQLDAIITDYEHERLDARTLIEEMLGTLFSDQEARLCIVATNAHLSESGQALHDRCDRMADVRRRALAFLKEPTTEAPQHTYGLFSTLWGTFLGLAHSEEGAKRLLLKIEEITHEPVTWKTTIEGKQFQIQMTYLRDGNEIALTVTCRPLEISV